MKHRFYIFLAVLLGVMLAFMAQSIIEIWYIQLLLDNYEKYSLGLSLSTLFITYRIASSVLYIIGVWFGLHFGERWWDIVYVQKRHWLRRRDV